MVGKKQSSIAEDDGFSYICGICRDFGELICCEKCGQGFHLECLAYKSLPNEDPWFCNDCKDDKVRCFECKKLGSAEEDGMFKCSYKRCKKFYHHQCTASWIGDPQCRVCPQHRCNACGSKKNSGEWKLFRCLDCPMAYHENCCPDGSLLLEDIPGYMICGKHENAWKKPTCADKIVDPGSLFQVLPLPEHICEFEVPRVVHEFAKKLKNKPPPFVHIRRNIYLVKKPKRRPEEEYMQCTCARSGGSRESCERECICSMLQYTCSSACGCGPSCTNLPFQKRTGRKVQLTKTDKCGWGLTAAESIKAGDFLIEYVGEVINDKLCEERLWGMKERGESNFYMCEINREMVIDATFKGNLSRFINHSCCPNTQLQKWQIDGETRIGVFAITDIQEGEFISYDYQFIPFGQEQDCFCGASACRGKLGRKPSKQKLSATMALEIVAREVLMSTKCKKSKLCNSLFCERKSKSHAINDCGVKERSSCMGRRVQIWWPLDQKYYSGTIVDFDNHTRRHTIEYDDGELEMLQMDKETWELEKSSPPLRKKKPDDSVGVYASEESFTLASSGDITFHGG